MPYADPERARKCARESLARRRAANPEKFRRKEREYNAANRERIRAKGRAWYARNAEKERVKDRERLRAKLPAPTRPEPATCEICGLTAQAGSTGVTAYTLCLDHDHSTNTFRGWICKGCNLMLGYARDKAENLIKGARYLEANSGT